MVRRCRQGFNKQQTHQCGAKITQLTFLVWCLEIQKRRKE
jgi:hypothetical protein